MLHRTLLAGDCLHASCSMTIEQYLCDLRIRNNSQVGKPVLVQEGRCTSCADAMQIGRGPESDTNRVAVILVRIQTILLISEAN